MSQEREQPEGVVSTGGRRYIIVHSRLNEETTAELDAIVEYLANDTESRRICEVPGRPDAVRYAIGVAAAWVREKQRREAVGG